MTRTLKIEMDAATVKALKERGRELYAFKAVEASLGGGMPVVWLRSDTYSSPATEVRWTAEYEAYDSQTTVVSGGQITASVSYGVRLGDIFTITSLNGTGTVTGGGNPDAVTIIDGVAEPFACGISQKVGSGVSPICAFPIDDRLTALLTPVEKVLLMFADDDLSTGTAITRAPGPGVLVDFTGAATRSVTYSIDAGWEWGDEPWATAVPRGDDLVPLLIEITPTLATRPPELSREEAHYRV